MPFANPSISDIISTSIQSRTGELRDNLTQNNILLKRLEEKGNMVSFEGGNVILEEIFYSDPATDNANSYSGYELINISPDSPLTASQWSIRQYAASISISGLEQIQNAGREKIIDLLAGRMKVSESRLMNRISTDLYGDGSGNGGKNVDGLANIVSITPASGVVGGIDASVWAFWRNKVSSGTPVTAANIQSLMTGLTIQQRRNADAPSLGLMDNSFYVLYNSSLQAIQRVNLNSGDGEAGSGFPSLQFYGAGARMSIEIANGAFTQSPANRFWSLNPDYLHWRPHAKRNFVPSDKRSSINQDSETQLVLWAGNLTCSNRSLQGVLTN